jgi:Tfp pilus assembly protein PilX
MDPGFVRQKGAPGDGAGFALILTLMVIVLIAIVLVAFFSSVRTEIKAGGAAGAGQTSRQLADLAVQIVQSQIQSVTTQGTGNGSNQLPTVAWASQPGMIRCYNNAGTPVGWYKLYSAQNMVVQNPTESLANVTADLPTGNWAEPGSPNYGVFTDLNSPVICESGTLCYPIVDPSGAKSLSTTGTAVAGFDISLTGSLPTPGYVAAVATSATNNPAAMPVRWLYVLRSGSLVPGVASAVAGQVSVPGASGSNPIVGRVAFWTDDETCKVNVNTAGDGTYYDTPRFASSTPSLTPNPDNGNALIADEQMAISPPAAGEFQRFVGHPAQTRISTVLPAIAGLNSVNRSEVASLISPFMQWGGSQGGTLTIYASTNPPTLLPPTRCTPYASVDEWLFATGLAPATSGTYRVENSVNYASLTGTAVPSSGTKSLFDVNGTVTGRNHLLNELHFFLSASSEAPEVNLFGQPRIAMWPINADLNITGTSSPYVTTFDKMIAHAASLNTNTAVSPPQTPSLYYFQRQSSTSGTNDFYAPALARNPQLYQYLRQLSNTAIPGYGGTFDSKYSTPEMDQILTEIFDYIRSTNANDALLASATSSQNYQYAPGRADYYYSDKNSGYVSGATGWGQVSPVVITNTSNGMVYTNRGFGRFDTITEVTMDFARSQQAFTTGTGNTLVLDSSNTYMTGLLYVNLFSPSLNPDRYFPDILVEIDPVPGQGGGLGAMTVTVSNSTYNVFPAPAAGSSTVSGSAVYSVIPKFGDWHNGNDYPFMWGGSAGTRQMVVSKIESGAYVDTASSVPVSGATGQYGPMTLDSHNFQNYKFCGVPIKVPIGGTFSTSQTPLDIKIYYSGVPSSADPNTTYDYEGSPGKPQNLVQEIQVNFPAFTNLPVPNVPSPSSNPPSAANIMFPDLYARFASTGQTVTASGTIPATPGNNFGPGDDTGAGYCMPIEYGDTVRSIIAGYNGDFRMLAAMPFVPYSATVFTAFPGSTGTTAASQSQSIYQSQRDIWDNDYGGKLGISTFQTFGFTNPAQILPGEYDSIVGGTSSGYNSTASSTGDFDNGVSFFPDGPYINKPDECGYQYYVYGGISSGYFPYYRNGNFSASTQSQGYSCPNRTIPSPVSFGSLPTGAPVTGSNGTIVVPPTPWQTLLFRPQPGHPGANPPEDARLLDWFWMPVVAPYAISTPMATAGKVNLNFQIAPFAYITRATALQSVLSSEYVISASDSMLATYSYKSQNYNKAQMRFPIYLNEGDLEPGATPNSTWRQFVSKFQGGQIFESASEICDVYLVPQGQTWTSGSAAQAYWQTMNATGDNSRERPYNGLYSRLTTKSNTYTVHVRAQALASGGNITPNVWNESPSHILSEYRGSYVLNRYIDPGDTTHPLPDFVTNPSLSLDAYYKYRILETRRFLP